MVDEIMNLRKCTLIFLIISFFPFVFLYYFFIFECMYQESDQIQVTYLYAQ